MVVQMLSMALTKFVRATTPPQKMSAASPQLHNKIGAEGGEGGHTFKFICKADRLFTVSIGSSFTTVA